MKALDEFSLSSWAGVAALLMLAIVFALALTSFGWAGRLSQHDSQIIRLTDRLKAQALALARHALAAERAAPEAFGALAQGRDDLSVTLTRLRQAGSATTASLLPTIPRDDLNDVDEAWTETSAAIQTLLRQEQPATSLLATVVEFEALAEDTLLRSDELVNVMVETGASPEQVYAATRQLMLLERLAHNLRRMVSGVAGASTAAERFDRDLMHFRQVTQGLLAGDEKLGIEAVADSEARTMLEELLAAVTGEEKRAGRVLSAAASLAQTQQAAGRAGKAAQNLAEVLDGLRSRYLSSSGARLFDFQFAHGMAGTAGLLTVLLLGVELRRWLRARGVSVEEQTLVQFQEREQELKDFQRRSQEALLRLLGEANAVADGDLRVNATVSEDLAGALAQALNAMVIRVRELVAVAADTAERAEDLVAAAAAPESPLSQPSGTHARRFQRVLVLQDSAHAVLDRVAAAASSLEDLAGKSVEATEHGGAMAAKVAETLDAAQKSVQKSAMSLQRLAQYSQEASDVAALAADMADQTNILALNTAIQASSGTDVAVSLTAVADELECLSERLTQVGRRVQALVRGIEVGARRVSSAVEEVNAAVGASARVVRETHGATGKTDENLRNIRGMVKELLEATKDRPEPVESTTQATGGLPELSGQVAEATRALDAQIGRLSESSYALRQVLSGFETDSGASSAWVEKAQEAPITHLADRPRADGGAGNEPGVEAVPPATLGLREEARTG